MERIVRQFESHAEADAAERAYYRFLSCSELARAGAFGRRSYQRTP